MRCLVGSENPVKTGAAQSVLQAVLNNKVEILPCSVPSGVPDQPMNEHDTRLGAVNRVKNCLQLSHYKPDDWVVAIEGGVDSFEDGPATFAYVVIYHDGRWSVGRSANLPLPVQIYQALVEGEELGPVMDRVFNTTNIKQKGGAIGLLTQHHATRQSVYEVALTLAMARFNFPELYPSA